MGGVRALAVAFTLACASERTAEPTRDAALPDTNVDAVAEDSVASDIAVDSASDALFEPSGVTAERIFTGPVRVKTPPTWNAHLSKLVADDKYFYAVHTHYPDATADRFAVVMRRAREGGPWTEVSRVLYPHQPPGVVMDRNQQMHMVFDCLRPGATDVTCFPGGAGTAGVASRFYHLTFSARDAAGALRFDTYANFNEWTAHSNGYHGLETSGALTVWSLADQTWGRVIQYRSEDGKTGSLTLKRPDTYLLYPIHAGEITYAGEFDPGGGTNAGYPASVVYDGNLETGFSYERMRLTPSTPVAPGAVGSYPSDVLVDDAGVFILSYRVDGPNCTELRRFDTGFSNPPKVIPLGCIDNYAKMQLASDGTLYILASSSSNKLRLGISRDRGDTFSWKDLPVTGVTTGDVVFFGATPLKPYTSPRAFDPDRFVFFFSGTDATATAQHSYLGTIALR